MKNKLCICVLALSACCIIPSYAVPFQDEEMRAHVPPPPQRVRVIRRHDDVRFPSIPAPGNTYDEMTFDVAFRPMRDQMVLHGTVRMPTDRHDHVTMPYIRLMTTTGVEFAMLSLTNMTMRGQGRVLQGFHRLPSLPTHFHLACGYGHYYDEMYPHMSGGPYETIICGEEGRILHRGAMRHAHEYQVITDTPTDVMFLGETLRMHVIDPDADDDTARQTVDYAVYIADTGRRVHQVRDADEIEFTPRSVGTYLIVMRVGTGEAVYWRALQECIVLPMKELTDDPAYFGRLIVNDSVDCGLATSPHQLKDGRVVTHFGEEVVSDRIVGSALTTVWERTGRMVTYDRGFFSHILGVDLKKNMPYLLEIEYPEDVPRTFAFVVGAGAYAPGIHTGVTMGQPEPRFFVEQIPLPLSGSIHSAQFLIWAGDYEVRNGVFVGIADPGSRVAPFSRKPLVFKITLYEMMTIATPRIPVPEDPAKRRYAWTESEHMLPADGVYYSPHINTLFYGMNAVSPAVISWNGQESASFRSTLFPTERYPQRRRTIIDGREYETEHLEDISFRRNFWEEYLSWATQWGLRVFPRIEYGGSDMLPEDARALSKDGTPYPAFFRPETGRSVQGGVDVTHPATFEDITTLIDDMFAAIPQDERTYVDALSIRRRADFFSPSYTAHALELFAEENDITQTQDIAQLRSYIVGEHRDAYRRWYQRQLSRFLADVAAYYAEQLPHTPDGLLYYHWHRSGMPFLGLYQETSADWLETWRRRRSLPFEGFPLPSITCTDLVHAVTTWAPLQDALYAHKFIDTLVPVAPVYGRIASTCAPYLDLFAHGDMRAMKITPNVSVETYVSRPEPGMGRAGSTLYRSREFALMEPILLAATRMPTHLSFEQTHPACFPSSIDARRFFMNFLSLPRMPLTHIPQSGGASALAVHVGRDESGTYVAVVNPTFFPIATRIDVPVSHPVSHVHQRVEHTDSLPFFTRGDAVIFSVQMSPMTLTTYRLLP